VILFLMVFVPIIDATVNAWPARLSVVGWRFGYFGSLSVALLIPVLGLYLLHALAAQSGDRRMTILVGVVALLASLCCLGATGVFALDALQMRSQVRADTVSRFNATAAWAMAKLGLAAVATLLVGISAFRIAAAMRRDERSVRSKPSSPLIVGRPAEPRTEVESRPTVHGTS
jgi:hypothetical protein